MDIYVKLISSLILPIVVSILFYFLEKKTKFSNLTKWAKQIIIGIAFGGVAVFGTEFGAQINGATVNVRDAGPMCAGLLFGAPAGIIAGVIGGVERWFAAYWGAGAYSQVACSVSTILAGIYAGLLRKYMFDDKRPSWAFGFATAAVMETLHLLILFLTHLSDSVRAYEIVKIVTGPMVLYNGIAVSVPILIITFLGKGKNIGEKKIKNIAQKVQARMLICVVLAYLVTTSFVYMLQTGTAQTDAQKSMELNIADVKTEIALAGINRIANLTYNRHIGEDGYVLIANIGGGILSKPSKVKADSLIDMNINIYTSDVKEMEMTEIKIDGVEYFWEYSKLGNYYIIAFIPEASVFKSRDDAVYINSFMEILVFAALFALIYFLIKRLVVDNIRSVNADLEKIIGGDLQVTVDVRTSSEFSSLSDDINSTVTTLNRYIEEAAARIDAELQFAKNIQASALPSIFPAYPNASQFDIYATMDTAKEVGGDFYDFYMLGDNKIIILMADVSGKGIPAAMFMMRAKTMIKTLAEEGLPADEIFTQANDKLCEGNDAGMFVTAWIGILDIKTGHMTYANAGHNPPLIYNSAEDKYSYLTCKAGFVLAGMEGVKYKLQELDLVPSDKIYLYTDGVTEATDSNNELYGEDRLLNFLNANTKLEAKDTLEQIKADVDKFVGDAEQFDDITMLMLKYFGDK